MNFKTTILLLVLLAAVGAYFAVEHYKSQNAQPPPQTTGKLLDIDSNNVKQVSIAQPDGKKISLEKSGTQWRLIEPVNAPADSFAVDELLRQVTGLTPRGQLPADQKSSVGLDHPNYVIQLTTTDGKTHTVSVGDKSQISDAMYVLVDDRLAPDIVSSGAYDQFGKEADSYRSKKLVDVNTDQIQQVAITQNGKTLKLERQGTSWVITQPTEMPADSSEVSNLLFAITDLNANEFVAKAGPPPSYGLTHPVMTVWFSTVSPTSQPATAPATEPAGTTIAFGRFESVLQKNVYAYVNNGPVVTVATTSQNSFNKTPLDLRDRKVVDIDPAQVESFMLSVDRPATTQPTTRPAERHQYTLARRQEKTVLGPSMPTVAPATQATTEPATQASTQPATQPTLAAAPPKSKWIIQSGGEGDANDSQVDAVLGGLHPLRADKFLEKNPTTQPAGNYTLAVHVGPGNGHGPMDYTIRFTSPGATGPAGGSFNDLAFETDRTILDKLDVNFRGGK
jgi:hypothetical protein